MAPCLVTAPRPGWFGEASDSITCTCSSFGGGSGRLPSQTLALLSSQQCCAGLLLGCGSSEVPGVLRRRRVRAAVPLGATFMAPCCAPGAQEEAMARLGMSSSEVFLECSCFRNISKSVLCTAP